MRSIFMEPIGCRSAFVFAFALCGCAAKTIVPVQMSQPGDEQLSCTDIDSQIKANEASAKVLVEQDKNTERVNTAKAVLSATPYLGLLAAFSVDLSNEDQIKARALIDRNERLSFLKEQKKCST